jgi:hypothetical protein
MLNGGIVPVNAGSSCTARSVEEGSRWTGVGDKEVDTYEAFAPTEHDREKSRCSSQREATSSREMVMEDPEQSTASMVRSLWGNGKLSEETLASAVGARKPPANIWEI